MVPPRRCVRSSVHVCFHLNFAMEDLRHVCCRAVGHSGMRCYARQSSNTANLSTNRQTKVGSFRAVCSTRTSLPRAPAPARLAGTPNLRIEILDLRGFGSSRFLILRGGNLMSTGNVPEVLGQLILVGMLLVGRLGVSADLTCRPGQS